MLIEKCLAPNYYIFSASFSKKSNKKTRVYEYPNWHNESDLTEDSALKNVRPLQLIPVISFSGWPAKVKKVTLSRMNKGSEDFDAIEPVIIYKEIDISELLN